jgi:stage III sporulation protein AE
MKTAAGMYGALAVLAICVEPFLRIGIQYLMMKATSAVCGIFGSRILSDLIQDFSTAMGIMLAMTGSACLMLLISTVCFMKGVV